MQRLSRSLHPLLLFVAACATTTPSPTPPTTAEAGAVAAARTALEKGDVRAAHALLEEQLVQEALIQINSLADGGELELALARADELVAMAPAQTSVQDARRRAAVLLATQRLQEARALYAAKNVRDAIAILDQVVTLSPSNADARALRGACALALGTEDGDPFLFEDALKEFLFAAKSGARPDAWIGASRASRLLYYDGFDRRRIEDAVLLAREAVRAVEEGQLSVEELTVLPSQVHAEAAFDLYRAARNAQELEAAKQAAAETRAALEKCIGSRPEEAQAWLQLSSLLEWEEQIPEGRDVLRNALSLRPGDDSLHSNHARLSRSIGGFEEVVSAYAHFLKEHPDSALGHWYYAVDSFELALTGVDAGKDTRASFASAEESFRACRGLEGSYKDSCLGYEVMCRAGVGLAMFKSGEVREAQRAFLSMEQLFEGGLAWSIEGRMSSGLVYLDYVVGHHFKRQEDDTLPTEERRASLLEAASLASFLHSYAPGDGRRANDAGFLNRDAGVALEQEARRVLRASMAANDDPELAERSRALYALARGHMNASADAYTIAALLQPADARVVNDTGLILTYYLQRDLERAAGYHFEAIKVGRAHIQKISTGEAEEDPDVITAVGDAYQNLGYLELTLHGASGAAREWFKECVAFDPVGREFIEEVLLPQCDLLEADAISAEDVKSLYRWGVDDAESLRAKDEILSRIEAARAALEEPEPTTPNSDALDGTSETEEG
jgi:tetratricopeptide (TPR) repeat protein